MATPQASASTTGVGLYDRSGEMEKRKKTGWAIGIAALALLAVILLLAWWWAAAA